MPKRRTRVGDDAASLADRAGGAQGEAGSLPAAQDDAGEHDLPAAKLPSATGAATVSPEASQVSATGPVKGFRNWWLNAARWTKAVFGALAVLATIVAAVPIIMSAFHTSKKTVVDPASADARRLNSLEAGELFSAFQRSLGASPTVNVWGRPIQIKADTGTVSISDYLFVLPTVYVEAFVGSNNAVDAYTMTSRTADMPQNINFMGRRFDMGKTTLANAPLDGITLVAEASAAHITAYYEISGSDEATLNQSVAVGSTVAGSIPHNYVYPASIFRLTDALKVVAGAPGYNPQSGYYRIEESLPTSAYLANSLGLRKKMFVNAITITAAGYPVVPEMISLHPEEVAPYAPK